MRFSDRVGNQNDGDEDAGGSFRQGRKRKKEGESVRRRKAEDEIIDLRQLVRDSGRCDTQPRLTRMMQ